MKKYLNKLYSIIVIICISLIYILILELITRTSLFFITNSKNIFFYGINKGLSFEIVYLSELKFNINDINKQNKKANKKKSLRHNDNKKSLKSKITIWTFGASLTYGYSCGQSSSSWPDELKNLKKEFEVINFGFPSIYSDYSIKILNYNLNNRKFNKPDVILWTHRDEEVIPIYFGLKRNKHKIREKFSFKDKQKNIYILRVKKTLETNLISFMIAKHIISRLQKRNNIHQDDSITNSKITNNDRLIAIENYRINTQDAIDLAKDNGVENFKIISLFDETELNKDKKRIFLEFFDNAANKLILNNNISYINTYDFLSNEDKKNVNLFFCENKHYTLHGNQRIAEIIFNNIKN